MNRPSSDGDVKSKLDVQASVSLPFNCNKLSRMVVPTKYDTQINPTRVTKKTLRSFARDVVNALNLRTCPVNAFIT